MSNPAPGFNWPDEMQGNKKTTPDAETKKIESKEKAKGGAKAKKANIEANKAKVPMKQLKLLYKVEEGSKLEVYWPKDKEYYPCIVYADCRHGHYTLFYEDGEKETISLMQERFRIVGVATQREMFELGLSVSASAMSSSDESIYGW